MTNTALSLEYVVNILTYEVRLKMLGALVVRAYSLEELAVLLGMKVARVARHLRKLQQLDLIDIQHARIGEVVRYKLNTMEPFRLLQRSWYTAREPLVRREEVTIDEGVFEEWERKIIRQFFVGSRLMVIPAGRKQLAVIVKWFAQLFEVGRRYQEKEVNEIIQRYYYDYAFFKKDLVGRGFMRRENGVLWRVGPLDGGHPS